jgi:hypothetical protein
MKSTTIAALTATVLMTGLFVVQGHQLSAQGSAALTGVVTSQEEGKMEGVVVSARKDGTFVSEAVIAQSKGFGAVHAIGFSTDKAQQFLYVGDGANKKVWILRRSNLATVGSFGHGGRGGGQFLVVHALAVDAGGNVYVGETRNNNRVQKFTLTDQGGLQ